MNRATIHNLVFLLTFLFSVFSIHHAIATAPNPNTRFGTNSENVNEKRHMEVSGF